VFKSDSVCARKWKRSHSAGALHALRDAEALAANREGLRDTLLEELALLHNHETPDRQGAWIRALEILERSCADLTVLCELAPSEEGLGAARGFSALPVLVDVNQISSPVGDQRMPCSEVQPEESNLSLLLSDLSARITATEPSSSPPGF